MEAVEIHVAMSQVSNKEASTCPLVKFQQVSNRKLLQKKKKFLLDILIYTIYLYTQYIEILIIFEKNFGKLNVVASIKNNRKKTLHN